MTTLSEPEKLMLEEFRPFFALLRAVMPERQYNEKGLDELFVGEAIMMCTTHAEPFTDDNKDDFLENIQEIWETKYLSEIWPHDIEDIPGYYADPTVVFPEGVFDDNPEGTLDTEICKQILADYEEGLAITQDSEEPQINHAEPEESEEKPKEKPTPTGEELTKEKDPRDSDPEWGLNGNEPPDLTDLPTRADSHLLNWEWMEAMAVNEDLTDLPELVADLHGKKLIATKRDMLDTLLFALVAQKQVKLEDAKKVFKIFDLLLK